MKRVSLAILLMGVMAWAQPPGGRGRPGAEGPPRHPPIERALHDPEMAQKLGLTTDQQKRMDDIFQQNRLKLIDLNASVQREEATLDPLLSADSPDEAKVLAQIDRVAQARAELEKGNARMLLGIRRVLTPDQWQKLRSEAAQMPPPGRRPPPPPNQE